MGLDMYLSATKYVSGYSFASDKNKNLYRRLLKCLDLKSSELGDPETTSAEISIIVAYWRKSNAIHAWFVDNCQKGIDDCRPSYVSRENLIELRDLCVQVLNNKEMAPKLLETRSGFFFGNTEYDEYFFNEIEHTITMLNKILNNPKFEGCAFKYQSSW